MKYIPYIIIAVLVCMLFSNRGEVEVKELHTVDTVFSIKTDTVFKEKPIVRDSIILDTFFIVLSGGNKINLPVTQKHYSQENMYDLWISGYNPRVDSIKTYNKVEYRTVTNDRIKYLYKRDTEYYLEYGFKLNSGRLMPEVGLSICMPKKISLRANIGYDRGISYGLGIGYKLN